MLLTLPTWIFLSLIKGYQDKLISIKNDRDLWFKAEIYQIKGDIYSKMGFYEEAEKSFSISLKYHKDYDLAWLGMFNQSP